MKSWAMCLAISRHLCYNTLSQINYLFLMKEQKMTSQEQAIKDREATAQKWAARKARWAAWKAQQAKQAKK
jgi:hypothetical protein